MTFYSYYAYKRHINQKTQTQLEDDKLVEYIKFQETASDEAIERWLQDNIPDFQDIFQDEIDILLGELAENADNLNQLT